MPLALDPTKKFPVVLKSDKEKPENERPTFYFRYVAAGYWRDVAEKCDAILKKKTEGPDAVDALFAVISPNLVGWDNMKHLDGKTVPFSRMRLKNIVTLEEAWELFFAFQRQGMEEDDVKKSASPSASNTARSAKTAKVRRRVKKKLRNKSR